MKTTFSILTAFIAAGLISSLSSAAVLAQSDDPVGPAAICMSRAQSDGTPFSIVLPPAYEDSMEAEGYSRVNCTDVFKARSSVLAYRDTICEIASNPSASVQERYKERLGENPSVLCALAEASVGEWKRGRDGNS